MLDTFDRLTGLLALCEPGDDALALLDKAREVLDYLHYRAFLACWIRRYYGENIAA